ncbi:MAG: DUF1566 domain-containing protein [Muribaculaceae bacterium]|nr:DUF1566 domain-containing protein [Muribaculaceae bacterium]
MRRILLLLSFTLVSVLCFADNYDNGKAAFENGDYVSARQYFLKVRNESPSMSKRANNFIEKCDDCLRVQEEARKNVNEGDMTQAYKNYLELLKLNNLDKEANRFLESYSPDRAPSVDKSNSGGRAAAASSSSTPSAPLTPPDYLGSTKDALPQNVEFFYMHDGTKVLCYFNPEKPEMTYHEALAYCNQLNLEGETGWRLPTMDEMLRFYSDYPDEKGKLVWVGYKGVIINNKTVEENEANSNMKYCPCMDGSQLVVHPFRVNSQNKVVAGELMRHHFFPVKTK